MKGSLYKLNKLIKGNLEKLNNSNETMCDIFNIIHQDGSRIFSEELVDGKFIYTTYQDCKILSIKKAHFFSSNLNVKKGSFVGLMMENSINWISSFWGLLMAGFKPLLINIRLGRTLNDKLLEMLNVSNVVCDKNYDLTADKLIVSDEMVSEYSEIYNGFNWENEFGLSTSATSLNVKVCLYSGNELANQIRNTQKIIKMNKTIKTGYKGNVKMLTFLPFYHIFGLVATYFWFAFFGQIFVFLKDLTSDTILNTIRNHKITHVFAVPMLWNSIYKEVNNQVAAKDEKTQNKFKKGIKLSIAIQKAFPKLGLKVASILFKEVQTKLFGDSIRFMITGGSYIQKDSLELINAIGYPLYNGYGMSEIGITSVELHKNIKYRLNGSIGYPFELVEYKIVDENLYVNSKARANKIITKDGEITTDFASWFNTGDIVIFNKKEGYYILGRNDDVVVDANGEKINPDLVEAELKLNSAKRFSVLGLENGLSLVVEVDNLSSKDVAENILREVELALANLKIDNIAVSKVYFTTDAIASETAIKVSRTILKKKIESNDIKLLSSSEFINSVKQETYDEEVIKQAEEIAKIIASVLRKDESEVSIYSHFILDLGGDSLDYYDLLAELADSYDLAFDNNEENWCYTALSISLYITNRNKAL